MSIYERATRALLAVVLAATAGCGNRVPKPIGPSAEESGKSLPDNELTALVSEMRVVGEGARPVASRREGRIEANELPLSRGDRLRIVVAEGEHFSGIFEVGVDGKIHIPFIKPILAAAITPAAVEKRLERSLVKERIFKPEFVQVSVRIQQWSGVHVSVAGAVFSPGRVLINDRPVEVKTHQLTQETGDFPMERFLTTAIRSAGGVRPDADLTNIRLIRNGVSESFDFSGILVGAPVRDIPLIAGDQVVVPSIGYLQDELVRPSLVTLPGFEIFISNLSTPADSNSESAIGRESRSIPYGTRLLRGLISANCIGGTQSTNASRMAILVTTDRISGKTRVMKHSVEQLVRHHDRSELNPYLMPNDGIACYDSGVTNIRDIARTFSDILNPIMVLRFLKGVGA